jgi:hypothetical protein
MNRPVTLYYAATMLFLLLDFVLGVNVRVAFLEPFPMARLAYYLICFVLFALMLWRPGWALLIGTIESLFAVVALTFSMALRVMIVTDEMIETGVGFVTTEEIFNYLIVGGIAYLSWAQGVKSLKGPKVEKNDEW